MIKVTSGEGRYMVDHVYQLISSCLQEESSLTVIMKEEIEQKITAIKHILKLCKIVEKLPDGP